MGLEDLTPRMWFVLLVGSAIAVLFIKSGVSLWTRNYGLGVLFLALGAALAFVFFRRRKIILVVIMLAFVLVNAGLTAIFHPSVVGILLTAASGAGLYLLAVWQARKYPHLTRKDWKTLFDHDPES